MPLQGEPAAQLQGVQLANSLQFFTTSVPTDPELPHSRSHLLQVDTHSLTDPGGNMKAQPFQPEAGQL